MLKFLNYKILLFFIQNQSNVDRSDFPFPLGATPVAEPGRANLPPRVGGRGDGAGQGHGRARPAGDDKPWGSYGSPHLRCVRCLQKGHAASCCESVLTPAVVRANVLRCWRRARVTGASCAPPPPTGPMSARWTPCLLRSWPSGLSSPRSRRTMNPNL